MELDFNYGISEKKSEKRKNLQFPQAIFDMISNDLREQKKSW